MIKLIYFAIGLGCSTLLGCSSNATTPSVSADRRDIERGLGRAVDLPLYGLGGSRAEGRGCREPGFSGFDFWVGRWNVYDPANGGGLGGTNIVTRELDGCAVEEHWTDVRGGRGRSLNTYDAGDGSWNQLWMDLNGLALIIQGSASRGV